MKTKLYFVITLLTFSTLLVLPKGFAQGTLAQPSVRLVYFLPSDRPARPDRIAALPQLIEDAQEFYADEMERHGYGRKTFKVEIDGTGEPVVHRIDGKFTENYYYEPLSDPKVWEELYEHFDDFQHIYFVVIDLSHEVLNGGDSCGLAVISFFPTGGYSPLLARKIAVRSRYETRGEEALGGCSLIPASGKCFDRYDVTLHELGHAFGLEHDFRQGLESHYVMSFGKVTHYQMRLSECAAEWLSVSHFFNSNPKPNNSPGSIQLISKPRYSSDGVSIRFKVTDADGLHQAQLLVPEILEHGAWGAERLFDYKRLTGKTNTIEFISEALKVEPVDRIMLQTIDVNGGITWATFLTDVDSILPRPKTISIPDKNLKKAIQKNLGLDPHANITDRDMATLRSLKIENSGITNISGLEYATKLEVLLLGRNRISNYNPLAQLSKLKRLFLWGNGINDPRVLPSMPQLEFLDLNWNQISDLSPLAGFTNLKELWLQGNNLADTSTLFQLHNGTFPIDEEVEVVKERDNLDRAYTLLIFQSLDLKVHVNPDVKVYQSLNSLQNTRKPVPTTDVIVKESPPAINVVVESAGHPPMYWINTKTGTLHRLVDTEVKNLTPNVRNATSLAIDMAGGKLYWTAQNPTNNRRGSLNSANLDGSGVRQLKDLFGAPLNIAVDTTGGKLYWTDMFGRIQRSNLDGSGIENVVRGLTNPGGIAIANGKVYWTEMPGRIRRANLDGSNIENVVTGLGTVMNLVVFDGTVYWTVKTGEDRGEIRFANLSGNPDVRTFTEFNQGFPIGISVDTVAEKLYWTTSQGNIGRGNIDKSSFQPDFGTGFNAPGVLALSVEPPLVVETPEATTTDAVVSVSPSPVDSPAIGEQLTLNLNISAGEAVAGYQGTLRFDPTALRYVGSSNGDYLPDGAFFVQPVVNRDSIELASTTLAGESSGDGTLATVTFEVLTVKPSTLTLSDALLSDSQGNTSRPRVAGGEITEPPKLQTDVNSDGVVNIQDLVLVASSFGKVGQNAADVNDDGVVNIADLVLVAGALGNTAAAPSVYLASMESFTVQEVRQWLTEARLSEENSLTYQRGILMLEQLLMALIPKETALLPNYPNPFNPETWIPYQLAKPADVTLTIYDINGRVVRVLDLGHQPAGIYQSRSLAAYWDGRNELGEKVASDIYFYTLSTSNFTATRKLLIRK